MTVFPPALELYLDAKSLEERVTILDEHPELFGPETDAMLAVMAENAAARGEHQVAKAFSLNREFIAERRRLVDECTVIGNWLSGREADPKRLAEVCEACDHLSGLPAFPDLPPVVRAETLHARATAVGLLEGGAAGESLDRVIADRQQVAALSPPDWPFLPEALYGLGVALVNRHRATPSVGDLSNAVDALGRCLDLLPATHHNRGCVLFHLGLALWLRFGCTRRLDDLDSALARMRELWRNMPSDPSKQASAANNLTMMLRDRYEETSSETDLTDAISFGHEAVRQSVGPAEVTERSLNLAGALFSRYQRFEDAADIDEIIERLKPIVDGLPLGSPKWAKVAHNLATALRLRSDRLCIRQDFDAAFALQQELIETTGEGLTEAYANGLGNAWQQRYNRTGSLDDLDAAIRAFKSGVGGNEDSPAETSRLWGGLASALGARYAVTQELSDLDASIAALRKSLDLLSESAPVRPDRLEELGIHLIQRYAAVGNEDDYAEGMRSMDASETAFATPRFLAGVRGSRADARWMRFVRSQQADDLDAAIEGWEQALKMGGPTDDRSNYENNLANALFLRHSRGGGPEDYRRARHYSRRLLEEDPRGNISIPLSVAYNWGHWAFARATRLAGAPDERDAWAEASEALAAAQTAVEGLLAVQLIRRHRADWLARVQTIPGLHAYALARQGRLADAVAALERGRGVFLSEALERNRADLERLEALGHGELLARYLGAVSAVQAVENLDQASAAPSARLRDLLHHRLEREYTSDELRACIDAIRAVEGYDSFFRPQIDLDWGAAAEGGPLVYLVATSAGGLALAVTSDEVRAIDLEITTEQVHGWLAGQGEQVGYLAAAVGSGAPMQRVLDRLLGEIGGRVMWPIAEALCPKGVVDLDSPLPIRLVPTGPLSLLPLHAGCYVRPSGPVSFLDEFTVSYLPSARALLSPGTPRPRQEGRMLTVGDPFPLPEGCPPLPYARFEALTVAALTPNAPPPLLGEDATGDAVRTAWHAADTAHLACHGTFAPDSVLQSALILARGERFTLNEVIAELMRGRGPARVVLSACQTALTDIYRLPEEMIGFPVGLLQAGAESVVAALWSVNDWSTSLLMARYWYELPKAKTSAAAIRAAQRWLRDSESRELERFATELYHRLPVSERGAVEEQLDSLTLTPTGVRPFKDNPYHWAGFTCWGIA